VKKSLDEIQEEEEVPSERIIPVMDETQNTREERSTNQKKRQKSASSLILNKRREKRSKGYAKKSIEETAPQPKMKNYKGNPQKVTNDIDLKAMNHKEEKEINKRENITKTKITDARGVSNFALKQCESAPTKVICIFCRSADVNEVRFIVYFKCSLFLF
jgi:hypothetical protein